MFLSVCVCVWLDLFIYFLGRHIFNVSSFEQSTPSYTTVKPIECAVLVLLPAKLNKPSKLTEVKSTDCGMIIY